MNKLNLTTKTTSATFLAIIMIAGTFAASSHSFMLVNTQAEPYYGMDKDKKQVNVSSLKCNNINVNVNGLELDVFPPFLSGDEGLAAEAVESNTDPSFFAGNGANSGSEINDFRFICINNNNNNAIVEGEEAPISPEPPITPEPPEPLTCEGCFLDILDDDQLSDLVDVLPPAGFGEINDLCEFIQFATIPTEDKIAEIRDLFIEAGIDEDTFLTVLLCLEDLGIIFIPTPMP